MDKRSIINMLFILSFPVYGIGTYVSANSSPSIGYLISFFPHFLILLFYVTDVIYKKEVTFRLNKIYLLMLLYILSAAASLFIGYFKGLPESNLGLFTIKTFLLLVPFHAFIVFTLYNEDHQDQMPGMLITGLSALLFINLAGYFALGLSNAQHSIEGRLNMPFLDGFYSGASILAILNLLIAHRIGKNKGRAPESILLFMYFVMNLGLLYMINSRLAMMLFLLVFVLFLFRIAKARFFYFVSLFTIPILLGSGLVLYELLQLPGLSSLMQRVDIEDVTTFNGRAFLWRDGLDWLYESREGLLFGNGFKGHYFLDLISDVAELWNTDEVFHLHMHSTSLEVLICQGLVAYVIFLVICFAAFNFYRKQFIAKKMLGAFVAPMLYLLFILQVDTFVYMDGLGFVLLALLVSRVAIAERVTAPVDVNRSQAVSYGRQLDGREERRLTTV